MSLLMVSVVVTVLFCGSLWVVRDYRQWKALGKGGIPYNLKGWWIVCGFRLHAREPFSTAMYATRIDTAEDPVRLSELPVRRGERPQLGKHPVPHRQLTQLASEPLKQQMKMLFDRFVQARPDQVFYAKSYYERHNDAVIIKDQDRAHPVACITHGEAAHLHPLDGSMHMIFSPGDARQVIEKGWGERHPLAGVPRYEIPDTYLMVYAPRDERDLKVLESLLHAAVGHVGMLSCECNATACSAVA